MATMIRVTDDATREQIAEAIAEAIAELRRRAKRYSRHDPRRAVLDEECDNLVADYLATPE